MDIPGTFANANPSTACASSAQGCRIHIRRRGPHRTGGSGVLGVVSRCRMARLQARATRTCGDTHSSTGCRGAESTNPVTSNPTACCLCILHNLTGGFFFGIFCVSHLIVSIRFKGLNLQRRSARWRCRHVDKYKLKI
jgi:hypothetical protein